jgi:hypothetical protein
LDIPLSDEQFLGFGSSIETAVRSQTDKEGFFVQPEFSHQLHCVVSIHCMIYSRKASTQETLSDKSQNLLRKSSFFNYEHYQSITFDFHGIDEDSIKTHIGRLAFLFHTKVCPYWHRPKKIDLQRTA